MTPRSSRFPGARRAEFATALGAVRGAVSDFPQRLGGGSDARPRPQRHDRDMAHLFLFVSSFNPEAAPWPTALRR